MFKVTPKHPDEDEKVQVIIIMWQARAMPTINARFTQNGWKLTQNYNVSHFKETMCGKGTSHN